MLAQPLVLLSSVLASAIGLGQWCRKACQQNCVFCSPRLETIASCFAFLKPECASLSCTSLLCHRQPAEDAVPQGGRLAHEALHIVRADAAGNSGFRKYNQSLGNCFAQCPLHEGCVKSRTCRQGPRLGSGKPLGYLAAWALSASRFHSKEGHMRHRPSHAERVEGRALLKSQANYRHFKALELGAGADSEPETVPP